MRVLDQDHLIRAALDLAVFVVVASSLVYVTQHGTNEKIADFVDALYFTVAALSTTGFGDITLLVHLPANGSVGARAKPDGASG